MGSIIEWDDSGYPTEESLARLKEQLTSKDYEIAVTAFYKALRENFYPEYSSPERKEVNEQVTSVWAYHTGGWSGNEDVISVLQQSWLFNLLLLRYDAGGHYYFQKRETLMNKQELVSTITAFIQSLSPEERTCNGCSSLKTQRYGIPHGDMIGVPFGEGTCICDAWKFTWAHYRGKEGVDRPLICILHGEKYKEDK